jgi:hypothetical protein
MKDLKADWQKWTRFERTTALVLALAASGAAPALLVFGQS